MRTDRAHRRPAAPRGVARDRRSLAPMCGGRGASAAADRRLGDRAVRRDKMTVAVRRAGQARRWCRKRDSNPRPRHYEAKIRAVSLFLPGSGQNAGLHCLKSLDRRSAGCWIWTHGYFGELKCTSNEARNCNRDVTDPARVPAGWWGIPLAAGPCLGPIGGSLPYPREIKYLRQARGAAQDLEALREGAAHCASH